MSIFPLRKNVHVPVPQRFCLLYKSKKIKIKITSIVKIILFEPEMKKKKLHERKR